MALKFQLENLEGVEETLHSLYREDGGKYVLDVEGVKPESEFQKLKGVVDNERKLSKPVKDALAAWETRFQGKTAEEIAAALERIPLLEAESQGKWDQKKHQEVLDQTVKQRTAPLELEKNKLQQSLAEKDQIIEQFKAADRKRIIHDAIRAEAVKSGFQEGTYAGAEGALLLIAQAHLTVNSDGAVVVSDDSKSYTPGLAVREALGEIKNQHPYLLKQSVGGGAGGNTAGGTPGSNPFKGNNMTLRGQFMNENPGKWEAAMKAAGLSDPSERHKDK